MNGDREAFDRQFPSPSDIDFDRLDPGIRRHVEILRAGGVETIESCEGGLHLGHAYAEPTVRFCGGRGAGFHALNVAIEHALPVSELRRVWRMVDGELDGPLWDMVFYARR